MRHCVAALLVLSSALLLAGRAAACTSILVGKGASADASVFVTYSADGPFTPRFLLLPGGRQAPGSKAPVISWEIGGVRGLLPQPAETYTVVGLMNEHQVMIGETTTVGTRPELIDTKGLFFYPELILLALQRSRSAREAIHVMAELCAAHGYRDEGETFSVIDKNEAWIMELTGKGPGRRGIVWVAARVPDDCLSVHANYSRIGSFPLDDPSNWLYAPDVVSFAVEKGYYDPKAGKPFSWKAAYFAPMTTTMKRHCAGRVWSVLRRAAPSRQLAADYFRGVKGAEDYPLFIKPDRKLRLEDVMALMRDHYEGTPFDMTRGIDAGPHGSPYRWRELTFRLDGKTYSWERSVSVQQAGMVVLGQARNWLPDPVGGVYWLTPDDAYTSCFTPLYCGIDRLPPSYTRGDYHRFDLDSAWWVFNLVSNMTYDRWDRLLPDVQKAQREQEAAAELTQPVIDAVAEILGRLSERTQRRFLTAYSGAQAEMTVSRWKLLLAELITKHKDGYRMERGNATTPGYREDWLRRVVKERPELEAEP